MKVETNWFRSRTSAMLHEIAIQKNRARAIPADRGGAAT